MKKITILMLLVISVICSSMVFGSDLLLNTEYGTTSTYNTGSGMFFSEIVFNDLGEYNSSNVTLTSIKVLLNKTSACSDSASLRINIYEGAYVNSTVNFNTFNYENYITRSTPVYCSELPLDNSLTNVTLTFNNTNLEANGSYYLAYIQDSYPTSTTNYIYVFGSGVENTSILTGALSINDAWQSYPWSGFIKEAYYEIYGSLDCDISVLCQADYNDLYNNYINGSNSCSASDITLALTYLYETDAYCVAGVPQYDASGTLITNSGILTGANNDDTIPEVFNALQSNIKSVFGIFIIIMILASLSQMGINNPVVLMFAGILMSIVSVLLGLLSGKILVYIIVSCLLLLLISLTILKPKE